MSAEVVVVVVVPKGASTKAVAKETGKSCFGFDFEPKLRLMLGSCMHLILLEGLEEKLGRWEAFKVGVEVEIRGGETRTFNEDEFMFGYKGRRRRGRERYLRMIRGKLLELRDGERMAIRKYYI